MTMSPLHDYFADLLSMNSCLSSSPELVDGCNVIDTMKKTQILFVHDNARALRPPPTMPLSKKTDNTSSSLKMCRWSSGALDDMVTDALSSDQTLPRIVCRWDELRRGSGSCSISSRRESQDRLRIGSDNESPKAPSRRGSHDFSSSASNIIRRSVSLPSLQQIMDSVESSSCEHYFESSSDDLSNVDDFDDVGLSIDANNNECLNPNYQEPLHNHFGIEGSSTTTTRITIQYHQ